MKIQMSLNNKETLKSEKNVEYVELNDYSESILDLEDIKFGIHLDKESKQLSIAIFNRLNGKLIRYDISYTNLKSFKNGLKILYSKQYFLNCHFTLMI